MYGQTRTPCIEDQTPEREGLADAPCSPSDTARLEYLEKLIFHCPHTEIFFNAEPETDEPIGWTIRTRGCDTIETTAPTFRACIDQDMAREANADVEPRDQ